MNLDRPDDRNQLSRRLYFTRENFDDYWIALMARIRVNEAADRLMSRLATHPLIQYQSINAFALNVLNISQISASSLLQDPAGTYLFFTNAVGNSLNHLARSAVAVPDLGNLAALAADYNTHIGAEKYVYNTVVGTLQVGISMHYARQVKFGAGMHLLDVIRNDNRQNTTRSLMALFSTLLSLQLKPSERFEFFSRRLELLIQRLRNWRPPVVLPEQLLLFCALRALPDTPYGPVRHIILASPGITYGTGIGMLRDVADTGAEVIRETLGSGSSHKPAAILCTDTEPPKRRKLDKTKRKKKGPSNLCERDGPCKHHGPGSFHATSECLDPTLSRRKKRAETNATTAIATVTEAPESSAVFYSPMFMARISKTACRYPRSQYHVHESRSEHFENGHGNNIRHHSEYDVCNISNSDLRHCIHSYVRPIPGYTNGLDRIASAPSRANRRKQTRSQRRKRRNRNRRRVSTFCPPSALHQPKIRKHSKSTRQSRRANARKLRKANACSEQRLSASYACIKCCFLNYGTGPLGVHPLLWTTDC